MMIAMKNIVGLDIGGANIKWAVVDSCAEGQAVKAFSREFALWRRKSELAIELGSIAAKTPAHSPVAVTMTGELADCFSSKPDGVRYIADCVLRAFSNRKILFYQTSGQFVSHERACAGPLKTAAANWHALANYCARFLSGGNGLLVDVGSTTTDVIPIVDGRVTARGLTDTQRIIHGELAYTGVVRSPVCSLIQTASIGGSDVPVAQELFATMIDAHLITGNISGNLAETRTADGRPAKLPSAMQRMARMLCADRGEIDNRIIEQIAATAVAAQEALIRTAVERVFNDTFGEHDASAVDLVVSGEGSWMARKIVAQCLPDARIIELKDVSGDCASTAAPAVAVAVLAIEHQEHVK